MKTILIKGYYGFNNLGDDFLLYSILNTIDGAGKYKVVVVSAGDDYSELFSRFPNLTCKTFPLQKWKKISKLAMIAKCDYWIIGGGGLFPSEDKANIPNWKKEITFAQKLRKKVCIYGIDINSIDKDQNKMAWSEISKLVSFMVVRNRKTRLLLKALGCKNVIQTADITFGLETLEETYEDGGRLLRNKTGIGDEKYILWSIPMLWSAEDMEDLHNQSRYKKLIVTLREVANSEGLKAYRHVFLPFFYEKDRILCEEITKGINGKYLVVDDRCGLTYGEKRLLFKEASFCICMRFHAAMFSLFHKKQALYISYADKTSDVIKEYGLEPALCEFGFSNQENFYKEFDLDLNEMICKIQQILSGGGYGRVCSASDKLKDSVKVANQTLIHWLIK